MIKANELRIGNFVKADGYYPYADIDFVSKEFIGIGIDTFDVYAISPIKITEEWLKRFGFIDGIFLKWSISKSIDKDSYLIYKGHDCMYLELKYVHQLQNLYFALTGQELTLTK